jgi:hypothetical protein
MSSGLKHVAIFKNRYLCNKNIAELNEVLLDILRTNQQKILHVTHKLFCQQSSLSVTIVTRLQAARLWNRIWIPGRSSELLVQLVKEILQILSSSKFYEGLPLFPILNKV